VAGAAPGGWVWLAATATGAIAVALALSLLAEDPASGTRPVMAPVSGRPSPHPFRLQAPAGGRHGGALVVDDGG